MFGIGGSELIVIALLALVLLGPERLPQLARALAKGYKEFTRVRRQVDSTLDELKREMKLDLDEAPVLRPPAGRRVPLDQLHAIEPEAQEQLRNDTLPVPETDDYLSATEGASPSAVGVPESLSDIAEPDSA